jgi:hypothetical protein
MEENPTEENADVRATNDGLEEEIAEGCVAPPVLEASVRSAPKSAAFVAKPAADWVAEIEGKATPLRLLDDLWLEGEMAVCFGERGSGKSVLAVQVADAIARGCPLVIGDGRWALDVDEVRHLGKTAPAAPRTVLYFDLKLTSHQFGRRYTWEIDENERTFSGSGHQFPAHFIRCGFDVTAEVPAEYKSMAEFLLAEIESEIRSSDARVVIIDSIERLTGDIMRSREAAFVMSRLNRLKHELGLSILVLANLARRSDNAPLAAGRLLVTRTISAFADSVFAVGHCRWDERLRYLKHLNSRSTDIIYDTEYLPVFTLMRDNGIFLSFWFERFYAEQAMLDPYLNKTRLTRADQVKQMAAEGVSQREIAHQMGMSLGSVNRSLKMWSPYDDRPKPPPRPARPRPTKIAKTVEHGTRTLLSASPENRQQDTRPFIGPVSNPISPTDHS